MSKIVTHLDFLKCFAKSQTKKQQHLIIDWALKKHIDTLSEICLNILISNLKLPDISFKSLRSQKKVLRILARKDYTIRYKKQLLKRSSGFFKLFPKILDTITHVIPELQSNHCSVLGSK